MSYHGTQHDFSHEDLQICSKIIFPLKWSPKYCMTCVYTLFFYKNIFYMNVEAEIYEIFRIV